MRTSRRHATRGALWVSLLATCVAGCEQGIATERLRQAGRIVHAARTLEAEGDLEFCSTDNHQTKHIRWLIGPQDKFRVEGDYGTVICDGRYEFSQQPGQSEPSIRELQTSDVGNQGTSASDDRWTNRSYSSLFFIDSYTLLMRVYGGAWLTQAPDCRLIASAEPASVKGHACWKVTVRRDADPATNAQQDETLALLWLDAKLGVLRKFLIGQESSYYSLTYDTIRINHQIDPHEFEIPAESITRWKVDSGRSSTQRNGRDGAASLPAEEHGGPR